jgi:hypothetical protein
VGGKIIVGQLIEKRIVMMLFMAIIMYIGITPVISRPKNSASTTITPPIDRYPACIYSIKFITNRVMHEAR